MRMREVSGRANALSAYALVGAELVLILIPFIVYAIVFSFKGELPNIFLIPEWSIAASVLMVQALWKFISFVLDHGPVDRGKFLLVFAVLTGCFLVTSLVILSLVIFLDRATRGLAISQVAIFIFAAMVFIHFGVKTNRSSQ